MPKISTYHKAIGVLIIIHFVGIIGLNLQGSMTFFEGITFLNLLFSLSLILYIDRPLHKNLFYFGLATFGIGIIAEIIGVNTGLLFGQYTYSHKLGIKFWGVPLMIGLNWFLLAYCSLNLSSFIKQKLVRIVAFAFIMTCLDVLLEPFAIQRGLWVWIGQDLPPFSNFVSWFATSALIGFIGVYLEIKHATNISKTYIYILVGFLLVDISLKALNLLQ